MLFKALCNAMLVVGILVSVIACAQSSAPTPSPAPQATPASTNIPVVMQQPTQIPSYVLASVWQTDPVVPILLYHRFKTNSPSTANLVSHPDFQDELETLYKSGYATISVEKWLEGDLRVPEGKRPLVLSMDDLFYRNQIALTPEGTPSEQTGL